MFKSVLVPTDGSDHASKAIAVASDLAARYEARIVFLHVLLANMPAKGLRELVDTEKLSEDVREELDRVERMQAGPVVSGAPIAVNIPVPGELLVAVGDVLLADAERVAKEHGVEKSDRLWKQGDPADCILSAADDQATDLIVMGSRGLSDLKGLFVGSVSHKVSHLSDCSCITVK